MQGNHDEGSINDDSKGNQNQYYLIGVTVHTGTANGGHYYSLIKDRTSPNKDKWILFNDAEVKPFDSNQIAGECFEIGSEIKSQTYDSVTDIFMDLFSFQKSNSAYMLFYEWYTNPNQYQVKDDETKSLNTVLEDKNELLKNQVKEIKQPII